MEVTRFILSLLFYFAICEAHQPQTIQSSSVRSEGRISDMDDLLRMNIEVINTNAPEFMGQLIQQAEAISTRVSDKDMAAYYVKLLKNIEKKGIDCVHDERERLSLIISSTSGAENEHARWEKNIVEGLVDMIAESLMMAHMGGDDMDMFGSFNLEDMNKKIHDEV